MSTNADHRIRHHIGDQFVQIAFLEESLAETKRQLAVVAAEASRLAARVAELEPAPVTEMPPS